MITQEYLKSALDYDPETGTFVWKHREGMQPVWNVRYARKKAGHADKDNYWIVGIDNTQYKAHRLAWLYMTGEWPSEIDHIDLDQSNNVFANLREVTSAQNKYNQGRSRTNTTGLKGVTYNKNARKWLAQISINDVNKYLGIYNCPAAAYFAYCIEAHKNRGEYARYA